jgi:FkbM family methyltransferase
VFVDVGANIGVYSLIAASVAGTEVHAFEPSSLAHRRLQENIDLNHLGGRVHPHRVAVGARDADVLVTVGRDTTNVVLDLEPPERVSGTEAATQVTLDHALDPDLASRVALVKIDVEGREADVLAGAVDLLRHVRPVLIIEANDVPALQELLEPLGYQPVAYDPDSRALTEIEWHATNHPNVLAVPDLDLARKRLNANRSR